MSSRREFIAGAAAAVGAVAAGSMHVSMSVAETNVSSGGALKANTTKSMPRIKSVIRREETVRRYGGNGDNWHMSWAADDRQYVSLCDGAGFADPPKASYNSRLLAISGGPESAKFHDFPGYPMLGKPLQAQTDARYYNFGTLALDQHVYQFMSTFNRSGRADELERPDPDDVLRFNGAKLIYSPDSGHTWHNQDGSSPVIWESWGHRSRDTMVFFEEDQEAFSLLTVLQMGKNYEHNRDGYVYVYAPNGNTEGTMNELVMFRVRKDKILDRGSYEYFAGNQTGGKAKWTKNIEGRGVLHTFPRGWVNKFVHPYAWQPSVVYNPPLDLYMMANWGMGTAPNDMWFHKPSYLGIWIAKNPWGPWTQIHEENEWLPAGDKRARAYQPQIAPKWIAADGKSFWLVWTDFQGQEQYSLNADKNIATEEDVVRKVKMMRKYMPYYSFNVQRVDLLLA